MSLSALALVLAAAVAHAAWNVIAHRASGGGLTFLLWGSVVSTVLWLPIVPLTGGIGTDNLAGFALGVGVSAVLHVAYMVVLQRGYRAGSLSTVYATARGTGPLVTVVVAVLALGERITPLAAIGIGCVILGVIAAGLVDRGGGTSRAAVLFGLLTGIAIASYTLWDTALLREVGMSPVAFMVGCTLGEIPLLAALLGRRLPGSVAVLRRQWRTLLAFGVLSPLSYILVLTAVTLAPVSLVAPIREVSVVLVSLFGAFVLREGSPARRVAASVVVVAGIVLLAV